MQDEEWRALPSLPHILVSDRGNVFNKTKARMLKQTVGPNDSRTVYITDRQIGVHRLVWETFSGPLPKGKHLRHIDGDHANNAFDNLEIQTRSRARLYD